MEDMTFAFANKIADFASEIDMQKHFLSEEDQKSCLQVVEQLYDLAESIADERASELYSLD